MNESAREREPKGAWKYVFYLTRQERYLLLAVLGLALLGTIARCTHIAHQTPDEIPAMETR